MAIDPLTSAATARTLLERAVAWDSVPTLTTAEVDDLLVLAGSLDADDATVYAGRDLNRAASIGWQWKAGKVVNNFTTALPDGMKFNREQTYDHCMQQSAAYAVGTLSVIGTSLPGRRSGIGSIHLVSTMVDPDDVDLAVS